MENGKIKMITRISDSRH